MNLRTIIVLFLICLFSVILNVTKKDSVPACMNADEAAFGYNTYSILKTGKDEYGVPMPLRLKSFGDFKMPLYAYLSTPFIATLGLNETGTRSLNTALAFLFPIAIFFLSRELFKNETAALISSFFVASSLGLAVIGRQAHEGYLSALLVSTTCIFFLRWLRIRSKTAFGLLLLSLFLLLLSYQSARIFAIFFFLFAGYKTFVKQLPVRHLVMFTCALIIFAVPDLVYQPARVSNLLFFKNPGLGMKTHELRQEGGSQLMYNKLTVGAIQFFGQHLTYYSPQFLATRGDENYRFGFNDMPPLTYVEYFLLFAGLYFLIHQKDKNRDFLIALLLITPLAGSLSWAGASLTRTLFLLPLIAVIAGYGFIELLKSVTSRTRKFIAVSIAVLFLGFFTYGWNFYLNHYNRRNEVTTAQQCGYEELGTILKDEYPKSRQIFISKSKGEPYIFTLFYLGYDPIRYQSQATLSAPDKYGFGQVETYDKFVFTIPQQIPPNSLVVGVPEDFKNLDSLKNVDMKKVRILKTGVHDDFWVYKP